MIKYSIVIPTIKGYDIVKSCLDHLVQNTDLTEAEVIIVANGSEESVRSYVDSLGHPFRLIWEPENIGAASAYNLGFKSAVGDYVIIIDDDTTVFPPKNQWVAVLLDPFFKDAQVGITGKVLHCEFSDKHFVVGFCSAIKREVFEQIGYYDEVFNPYFGHEIDFCVRANLVGFKIAQVEQQYWPVHHICECEVTQENIPMFKSVGFQKSIKILPKRYNSIKQEDIMPYVMSEPEYKNLPEGEFTVHDVAVYRYMADNLPDDANIVEIGSGHGKSICSIFWYLKTKKLQATLVDDFRSRNGVVVPNPEYIKKALLENAALYEISSNINLRDIDSVSAASEFPDNHFDLIFIDADHSEEAVRADVSAWLPKLKDTGHMIGHDSAWCFAATSKMFPEELMMCGNIWLIKKEDILKRPVTQKTYDCFMFFNELDLLEIRLNELDSVVDYFVLVEATKTHSGIDKPLYFDINKDRYQKFLHKIIHIVVDDMPDTEDAWDREFYQRNAVMRGLICCSDDDIIMVSDVDEIPSSSALLQYKDNYADYKNNISHIFLRNYRYYINNILDADILWTSLFLVPYKILTERLITDIRGRGGSCNSNNPFIVGGWHFSYLGGVDDIVRKIESFAHQELNNDVIKNKERINHIINSGQDLIVDDTKYRLLNIDDSFPAYIISNIDKFGHLIRNRRDVYDCFPFFNELDLLEIRLNELDSVVDYFVLVEATKTHSGVDKPLYFDINKDRYQKFLHKIIHIVVDSFPVDSDNSIDASRPDIPVWLREQFQRDACMGALKQCADDDMIIISDVDEIPRSSVVAQCISPDDVYALDLTEYTYYINYKKCSDESYPWIKILSYGKLKSVTPCGARYYGWDGDAKKITNFVSYIVFIKDAGWHFSFMGGIDKIKEKIESWAHQEYNTDHFKNNVLLDKINNSESVYGYKYQLVDIDNSYPAYITENIEHFSYLCFDNSNQLIKYSIVIPSYNHLDDCLKPCIESILKYIDLTNAEVIIVFDGNDGTPEYIESLGKPFKCLSSESPRGAVTATNIGIAEAKGEFIIFLNNDIILLEQSRNTWVEYLLYPFTDPKVGVTGPVSAPTGLFDMDYIDFFCAAFRRSLFDEIGLLEDIIYGDCQDWCIRLQQHGYSICKLSSGEEIGDSNASFGDNVRGHMSYGAHPIFHIGCGRTLTESFEMNDLKSSSQCRLIQKYGEQLKVWVQQKLLNKFDQLGSEEFVFNEVIRDNIYRVEPVDVRNAFVIDIGANVGLFTLLAAEYGANKVISIEPELDNYSHLRQNCLEYLNVNIINGAVSDTKKTVSVIKNGTTSFVTDDISENMIETYVLSELLDLCPDGVGKKVLKMDIEGAEYSVLNSVSPDIIKQFDVIYIELHSVGNSSEESHKMRDYLLSLGYNAVWSVNYYSGKSIDDKEPLDGLNVYKMIKRESDISNNNTTTIDKDGEKLIKENILDVLSNDVVLHKKKISIIIPTYNGLEKLLKPCLKSIIDFTDLSDIEVLVISNGCTDGTKEYVESLGEPFRVIYFDKPLGYTVATNEGIKRSNATYCVLLNNDTILLPQQKNTWIDMLINPMQNDISIGITGPSMKFETSVSRNFLIFFCATVRSDVFAKIGLLDEDFSPGGCEDIDFCIRAENAGFVLKQVPLNDNIKYDGIQAVGGFPIYHAAEKTVKNINNWDNIFENNINKLKRKYNKNTTYRDYRDITMQPDNLKTREDTIGMYDIKTGDVSGKQVVDIGANKGMFTMIALEYGASMVYSVEPNGVNFKTLSDNVGADDRVKLLQYAAYDDSKQYVSMTGYDEQSLVSPVEDINNLVPTITLSKILEQIPKDNNDLVLKVDCEGSEFPFLLGSDPENIRRFKTVFIEIHGHPITDKEPSMLFEFLVSLGYDVCWSAVAFRVPLDQFGNEQEEGYLPIYKLIRKEKNSLNNTFDSNTAKEIPIVLDNSLLKKQLVDKNKTHAPVTAVVSTKDRYFTTLPHLLISIANQTVLPEAIRIYDDGEQINLTQNPLYVNIFGLLEQKKIKWYVHFGEKKGQVLNHQKSIFDSETEWIWRCDDDNIAEPDVLEKLLSVATDKTGAVGGLVLDPKYKNEEKPPAASNKIEDIFTGLNIQWFKHEGVSSVDHLYSSFIYRREAAKHGYCLELSPVGHREETIFTYEMKQAGWDILVNPDATTWHFRNSEGGIRSYPNEQLWHHDEEVFAKKINLWSVVPRNKKVILLNNGLGDHLSFRHILPELIEKYGRENLIISCCFPGVFEDDNVQLISIQDGILHFNNNIGQCDIYKLMWDLNWKGSMVDAFRRMYL